MQWSAEEHAGFCPPGARPWLPVADGYEDVNVASQRADSRSMLTLYRRLLELRRATTALSDGAYATLRAGDGVLAYRREAPDEQVLVALNLTAEPRSTALSGVIRLSTHLDRVGERVTEELILRPDEGLLLTQNRWASLEDSVGALVSS
jgi:alpha-glucosidase